MPPRKRAKASAASTPLGDTQPKTPQDSGPTQSQDDQPNDPWADEQETQLFKSMMKWKPTGLHKHFRMISIHNDMRSHGFATEDAPHTRIPGIWKKLDQLYALEALDERENQYAFSEDPDPLDRNDASSMPEFELPEDDFGELMWHKRFHREDSAAASSPAMIPTDDDKALYQPGLGLLKDLPGSARSQKAETPADATPTPRNAKSTRASRAQAKSAKGAKAGASAAKASKAQSAASESAEEEEEEEEEEESSAESEEESAPTTRRTNRARARPAPKRTRKR
ncbi:chromatin modification-related protein EAF7-domain-containing protein [Paraphoma chrysanthemicola]|uniref:Chromatin modification-related protein EAF7-domain-containing protein n=1 Tax=Paraphoma chrysanthemicola TaxID=798071 RepID=A0A8K0R4M2_9PLEO|nr:chromatin modification-related protein EAF7-domain-containing protein [Paraphoma chrysanthemicola]